MSLNNERHRVKFDENAKPSSYGSIDTSDYAAEPYRQQNYPIWLGRFLVVFGSLIYSTATVFAKVVPLCERLLNRVFSCLSACQPFFFLWGSVVCAPPWSCSRRP